MSIDELKIVLDRVQSLPSADQARFQMMVILDCVENVAYYGFTAIVVFLLGRRIIQAMVTALREGRSTDPPSPR